MEIGKISNLVPEQKNINKEILESLETKFEEQSSKQELSS
jgi:DNA/RNA endonuclease G (NUC1)